MVDMHCMHGDSISPPPAATADPNMHVCAWLTCNVVSCYQHMHYYVTDDDGGGRGQIFSYSHIIDEPYCSRYGCSNHTVCTTLFFAYIMSSASPRSTSSKRKTPPSLSGSDCEGAFSEVLTRQARRKQKKVNKHRPEFQFNIQELKYGKKVTLAVSLSRISCLWC